MARRKQLSITERLTQVEAQIVQKKEELKALKAERKNLREEKKKEDMEEIYQLISLSGKSVEEVKELLSR